MHLYWHYYSKGVHRPIKTYWHYYFYSINSPTLSFLGPHKKTSPAERLLLHPPNKRTQKNNIFQNKRPDLFFNFLFPHSLIIQGSRLCVSSSSFPPAPTPRAPTLARGMRPRFDSSSWPYFFYFDWKHYSPLSTLDQCGETGGAAVTKP